MPAKNETVTMITASPTHLMNMAAITRLRLTALLATINLKPLIQAAPTSLLRQSITPIIRQMRMPLNRRVPTTRTHSTILPTIPQKAHTPLTIKPEVHMATVMLL